MLKFLTVSRGKLATYIILEQQDMPLETARHQGRKCTGHERSRGWYLVSVQLALTSLTLFYLFRKALDNIDLNLVSHRYVSGVLKDDHFVSARSRAPRF